MTKPREQKIQNLASFTAAIESALKASKKGSINSRFKGNLYRGHGCSVTFQLEPSLYRHPTCSAVAELLKIECTMLHDFGRQIALHESKAPIIGATFDTLFFMQHYGVPTRLLDWTGNPFIALHFALTDAKGHPKKRNEYSEDAAVWILDPVAWNSKALEDLKWGNKGPAEVVDDEVKSYQPRQKFEPADVKGMYDAPVAIVGTATNPRMLAQKGVFTVFGKKTQSMEAIYEADKFPPDSLVKLVIPKSKIARLLDSLTSIGYTDSVSYPDLHGLAREIKRQNGFSV